MAVGFDCVLGLGVVVVLALVEHCADDPVLARLLGPLQLVEVVLVEDVVGEQLRVEVHVLQLVFRVLGADVDGLVLLLQVLDEVVVALLLRQPVEQLVSLELAIFESVFEGVAAELAQV